MKLAFIDAGRWFFGSIFFAIFLGGRAFEGESIQTILLALAVIGFLVGGFMFFTTWYDYAKKERELQTKERRKALKED